MPFLGVLRTEIIDRSRKLCKLPTTNYELRTHHWRRRRQGFSLIEIVIALFVIVALGMILFSSSGTLFATRNSKLQELAAKIASREVENLRITPFTTLITIRPAQSDGSEKTYLACTSNSLAAELAKLKNSVCTESVLNYDNKSDTTNPITDIKHFTIIVNWESDRG